MHDEFKTQKIIIISVYITIIIYSYCYYCSLRLTRQPFNWTTRLTGPFSQFPKPIVNYN